MMKNAIKVMRNVGGISYDVIIRLILMLNFYRLLVKDHYGVKPKNGAGNFQQQQVNPVMMTHVRFFVCEYQRIYFALWQKDQIKKRKWLQQVRVHNSP